ncbi:MAG: 2-amino-4-hydroxy-6-hydroxymethyldihydropteridine diphosphokinase [Terracidiphilus sp.]
MHLATISLGGNLPSPAGPPDVTLAAAVERLTPLGRITAKSSLYSTTPVGFADQPRVLNAAVNLETAFSPLALLSSLLEIELDFGRDRFFAIHDGPRTLDLDLVLYGDLVLSEAGLELPHPRFAKRAFVLVPLNEISPQFRDPRSGRTVSELLQALHNAPSPSPGHASDAVVQIESDPWRAVVPGASPAGATLPVSDPTHG